MLIGQCRGESEPIREEEGDLPVLLSAGAETELGRRAETRTASRAIPSLGRDNPSRYSDAAVVGNTAQTTESLNHTTDTVSQLYSKPRRIQSSLESENITNHDYSDVVYLINLESGRQLGLVGVSIQDPVL